jgi:hypothetical protein
MIDKQRDTMIKVKKDYRFKYTLSYKAVSRGSDEKKYIRTLRYLKYTYLIYLNLFLFKVHETGTIKYQTLIK